MKTQDLPKRHSRFFARGASYTAILSALLVAAPAVLAAANPASNQPVAQTGPSAPAMNKAGAASDQSKEQLIRTLVNLTDKSELQSVFSQQFIDRVSSAVSMFGPAMDAHTMDVIQQQTQAVIQEHIEDGDALYSVLAPVYEKHFNIIELNQLVNFYQSPLGQKLVQVSPQLLTESLDLGQQWGLSLVPEIMQRVQSRLHDDSAAGGASTRNTQ